VANKWREHPKLCDRFHPESPDDVQVLVHDGGPRLTDRAPELVWVRVTGADGDLFTGQVLNRPDHLATVSEGAEIQFVAPDGGEYLLLVTQKYLRERPEWLVEACDQCGLSELFDAPSDLMRVVFPDMPEGFRTGMFTAYCGCCGGCQMVRHKDFKLDVEENITAAPQIEPGSLVKKTPGRSKKWWEFWK